MATPRAAKPVGGPGTGGLQRPTAEGKGASLSGDGSIAGGTSLSGHQEMASGEAPGAHRPPVGCRAKRSAVGRAFGACDHASPVLGCRLYSGAPLYPRAGPGLPFGSRADWEADKCAYPSGDAQAVVRPGWRVVAASGRRRAQPPRREAAGRGRRPEALASARCRARSDGRRSPGLRGAPPVQPVSRTRAVARVGGGIGMAAAWRAASRWRGNGRVFSPCPASRFPLR